MAVALYARVSTTRQAEKDLSIPDQLRQLREWCARQGLEVGREYVEPGASATDDRRAIFQDMIAAATAKPSPFEAIVVHSLSRFFRDHVELALYERKLKKSGVKLVSITQQTGDDTSGELARSMFALFDEYQSKENAKHTLRAMQENARQGFWNGSRPPFGYRTVTVEHGSGKGGTKKKLAIDEAEAVLVRKVFDLYLHGLHGETMGAKNIAAHFNAAGVLVRGQRWSRNRVHRILTETAYMGTYLFNQVNVRTGAVKPREEWIPMTVPTIVPAEVFEAVASLRRERSPEVTPPRVVNSPTLLTGLLRCANCGASMTLITGKGGKYRYYKCNTRVAQHAQACSTPALPMEKLDAKVLEALADKVLAPQRLKALLSELKGQLKQAREERADGLRELRKELAELDTAIERLYEAVEKGLLPMDDTLASRAAKLKNRRAALLRDIDGAKQAGETPLDLLSPATMDAFARVMRKRLLDPSSGLPKRYLHELVSEITFDGDVVRMQGRNAALLAAAAGKKMGTARVPTSSIGWGG